MVLEGGRNPLSADVIVARVLLVEDEADTAQFLKTLLEAKGFQVAVAKDGGQAHGSFVMRKPDLVILDLILPGESGFEVCDRIKRTDPNVPVLVLSAIDMEDARDLAKRVGADGYMTKPFDPEELLTKMTEVAREVWVRSHAEKPVSEDGRIRFTCRCGKKFKVSPVHRGKSLTCPECGEPVTVPRHD